MTEKELIAKAKLRVRKTSNDVLDEDVGQLVAVALADLKRIGVHPDYLDPENITDPLIIEAALIYTKVDRTRKEREDIPKIGHMTNEAAGLPL